MQPAPPLRFGAFIAPFHPDDESPTEQIHRDLALVQHMDALGYDEAWIGEHHSGSYEIIGSPEIFIAHAAAITRRIRLGTGVTSLSYHHPLLVADRMLQLDHQTRGRVMLGMGPGQLPSDAFMLGVDVATQRRRMNEAIEVICALFRGETVTRKSDWFELNEGRLQLPNYSYPHLELAVASAISPSGARAAGQNGIGLLSVAASTTEGFEQLPKHWNVCEEKAQEHGKSVSRNNWRLVAPMHIAETRAQAEADMAHGTLRLLRYTTKLGGIEPEYARSHDAALDAWVNKGIATFGKLTLGTPDDAIAAIEAMREHSGGFGCFLLLAHNCANWEATRRSAELIARYVMPAVNRANAPRHASIDWASANAPRFIGAMVGAIGTAIAQHEQERSERGGKGTAWGTGAGSFIPDGKN